MRILIADDDAVTRRLLEHQLDHWGYDVVAAADGQQTWELLQADEAPSLLLLDWNMPGLDGTDLCRRIRETPGLAGCYVLLGTARQGKGDVVSGLESGADDYVTKPYDWDELRARFHVGERVLKLQANLSQRVRELNDALDHIKTLQGILPICMHCHRICDDHQSWQRLEAYIENHSEAAFSHSLCPECLERYYPSGDSAES